MYIESNVDDNMEMIPLRGETNSAVVKPYRISAQNLYTYIHINSVQSICHDVFVQRFMNPDSSSMNKEHVPTNM